jgi:protocatechuate 3,4-dioxygenase beta subunit
MRSTASEPAVELIVLTDAALPARSAARQLRRLRRHLARTGRSGWTVTVAAAARELDTKGLRERFADRDAAVVALVRLDASTDLGNALAPIGRHMDHGVSRRSALASTAGAAGLALLAACASTKSSGARNSTAASTPGSAAGSSASSVVTAADSSASSSSSSSSAALATAQPASASSTSAPVVIEPAPPLAAETTEGPYYLDLNNVRRDIRDDRTGVPFDLSITVVDDTGRVVPNAAVDIWHCDAAGAYSGFESGTGATFLRGTQIAGPSGTVAFTTVFPGFYPGRTVHIHVLTHVSNKVVHTGQIFFDDAVADEIYASNTAYGKAASRGLRNARDGIFRQAGGVISPVTKEGSGYASAIVMAVRA